MTWPDVQPMKENTLMQVLQQQLSSFWVTSEQIEEIVNNFNK
jgi:hypothetical protein